MTSTKDTINWGSCNWGPGLFIIGYHLFLLIAVPLYLYQYSPSWTLLICSFILFNATGVSITAGYHRLFSHKAYQAHPIVEWTLLFFGTMATQGSVLRWSFDHRHHHSFVDTDNDPYSINKGFWYAHFLWLFEKPKEIDTKVVADLVRNPRVLFQHNYYALLSLGINLLAIFFVGWWTGEYFGAFLFAGLVRMFFLHHFTWFINSLAHTWGARTFCQELSAADNYIISLVTFGEGYHNYHHTFAYDYRNGIRWYHFDPSKWLIWTLSKLRLTSNLKMNKRLFIQERIILDRKALLLDKLQAAFGDYKEMWEESVTKLSESLIVKLQEWKKLSDLYLNLKQQKESKDCLRDIKQQIKAIKKGFKREYSNWKRFYRHSMAMASSAMASSVAFKFQEPPQMTASS